MDPLRLIIFPGFIFIVTVLIGFRLSRHGKPYRVWLFNIHKLVALTGVVLVGLRFRDWFKSELIHPELIVLIVLIATMTIMLFVSGALMSQDKLNYDFLRFLHRIAPVGLVLAGILIFLVYR